MEEAPYAHLSNIIQCYMMLKYEESCVSEYLQTMLCALDWGSEFKSSELEPIRSVGVAQSQPSEVPPAPGTEPMCRRLLAAQSDTGCHGGGSVGGGAGDGLENFNHFTLGPT